jgi:hypothetical protein
MKKLRRRFVFNLPSYLIISADIERLEQKAAEFSKTFNSADVFYIKRQPDKKEIIVSDIEQFNRQTVLASVSGKKLFIVFEADLMNSAAQNKLLKTIEDMDSGTTVLFLAKTDAGIIPTLRSRFVTIYEKQDGENLTIKKMRAKNPDADTIYDYANKLFNCTRLDDALPYLPVLIKSENAALAFDALHKSLKTSGFLPQKKYKLYGVLSEINRNISVNCNSVNTFDLLLLELF